MGLDELLALFALGASLYYGLKDAGYWAGSVKTSSPATVVRPRSYRSERREPVQKRSAQQNALNAGSDVQPANPAIGAESAIATGLHITPKELTQLAEAIRYHTAGQSKQAAIEAAFQCSKGGGKSWKRACELWAMAMGEG